MPSLPTLFATLAFNRQNQLMVRRLGSKMGLAFTGSDADMARARLQQSFPGAGTETHLTTVRLPDRRYAVSVVHVRDETLDREIRCVALESLARRPAQMSPGLAKMVASLDEHLVRIAYLHLGENDFIYQFRPEKERNSAIYANDRISSGLYQSKLCVAIKQLARRHERSATRPVSLDFGAVEYAIPSHFGFCLGVKNAIERAYETLAAHPDQRVFMLSELIHNPFVNADLCRRGLRYLQTDKGVPFTTRRGGLFRGPGGGANLGHAHPGGYRDRSRLRRDRRGQDSAGAKRHCRPCP